MEQKRIKKHFPFKKIEKLIEMATKNQLDFLEVDGIKIIPRRAGRAESFNKPDISFDENKLTPRQKENYILFGKDIEDASH